MVKHKGKPITRKEFIKKSTKALLTCAVLKEMPLSLFYPKRAHAKKSPEYRLLGKTGIKVTAVGFGASRTMEPALVKSALDAGINLLDTGRVYFNGQNEAMLGKVIKGIRKEVIIQSRGLVSLRKGKDPKNGSDEAAAITKMLGGSLEKSLKALQTDYIDIFLIHGANSVDVIHHQAVIDFFSNAKKKGQIRACGFSSHDKQVELLQAANESKFYDVIMIPYNHKGSYTHSMGGHYREWDQHALERELIKAEQNGIGIIAMKTCSAGPYSPDGKSPPSYREALRWILKHPSIGSMAVAMGSVQEISENAKAMFP